MAFCRGSNNDPIEFRVRENIADALIGQLIYKNITREEYRSSSTKVSPPTTATSLQSRQERYLNSRFSKSKSKIKKPTAQSKRRHRDVNFDTQFYVPVTPSVFYDDLAAFESERIYVPIRRKFTPTKPVNYTAVKNVLSRANVANTSNIATVVNSATDEQAPEEITTIDNLLNDMKKGNKQDSSTTSISKVVLVTPRPIRMRQQQTFPDVQNTTRANKQIKGRSELDTRRGLRFIIANQHDVTDMITITNDGTLMTVKALDREERDVYRLTIIAEYFQGYVTGAGIYQVNIYVDDVNDNPPVFNLHSYSGSIPENSAVNTEVVLDQQMLVHDADVGENAVFDLMLQGEGSIFFSIEKRNSTQRSLDQLSSLYSIGNQRFARALSKINANRKLANASGDASDSSYLDVPRYVLKYIGPNVIDREIQNYYEFTVVARDKGGLSSEVKFALYVTDLNDNAPIFDKIAVFKDVGMEILEYTNDLEMYFIDRIEPDTLTYPIRHHVRDVDSLVASPSNVNYEIMQLAEGAHIGTPRRMNGDSRNKTAKSHSSRSRSRRRNNEKPYPAFSILENTEVGTIILKLFATDEDYEDNAQVSYKIVSETYMAPRIAPKRILQSKFFGIDGATGELRIYKQLPAQAEILLNVSAIDSGGLSDSTVIKFKVYSQTERQFS